MHSSVMAVASTLACKEIHYYWILEFWETEDRHAGYLYNLF